MPLLAPWLQAARPSAVTGTGVPTGNVSSVSRRFQDFVFVFSCQKRSFDGALTCTALALGCLEFSLLPEPAGSCLLPNLASFTSFKKHFYLFTDFWLCGATFAA